MPIRKSRYDYTRVYRPNGSKYAHGKTMSNPELAVASAMFVFNEEFGYLPESDDTLIEILGVTAGYAATVMEIKES